MTDQSTAWALRELLAFAADDVDAVERVDDEIRAAGGCRSCIYGALQNWVINVLEDVTSSAAGGIRTDRVTAYIAAELAAELDRVERSDV